MNQKEQTKIEKNLVFQGYASVFNIKDKEGDIILNNAFTPKYQKIPLLREHDTTKVVGFVNEIRQDNMGLFVEGFISDSTLEGASVISSIKNCSIKGLSIGYITIESEEVEGSRIIKKAEIVEISIVAIPTNELAQITKYEDSEASFEDYSKDTYETNRSILDNRLEDVQNLAQRLASIW